MGKEWLRNRVTIPFRDFKNKEKKIKNFGIIIRGPRFVAIRVATIPVQTPMGIMPV